MLVVFLHYVTQLLILCESENYFGPQRRPANRKTLRKLTKRQQKLNKEQRTWEKN